MKKRSLALIALIGTIASLAWAVLLSQQALAQCAVGAVNTSCGSGAEKQKRATPTTNPALLSPLVNPQALVKPTPTGLAGNPACNPDPTQLQSLCAALPGFGSKPGPIPASQPGQCGPGLDQGQCGPGPQSFQWLGVGGGVLAGLTVGLLLTAVLKTFVNEDKGISYYFRHMDGHHTLSGGPDPTLDPDSNFDEALVHRVGNNPGGNAVNPQLDAPVDEDKGISYYFKHTDGHHTLDNTGEPQSGQTGNADQAGGAESAAARFPDE